MFIHRSIKRLKGRFGRPIDYYQVVSSQSDVATGIKSVTLAKLRLTGLLLWESEYLSAFRNMFTKRDVDTGVILFDRDDLLEVDLKDYFVINNQKYEIVKFQRNDDCAIAEVKATTNVQFNQIFDANIIDVVETTDANQMA